MISRRGANHSPRGHLLVCQRRRQLGGKRRTCNEKASLCDNGQMRFMTKSGTEALDYQRGRAQTRPDDPLAKAKVQCTTNSKHYDIQQTNKNLKGLASVAFPAGCRHGQHMHRLSTRLPAGLRVPIVFVFLVAICRVRHQVGQEAQHASGAVYNFERAILRKNRAFGAGEHATLRSNASLVLGPSLKSATALSLSFPPIGDCFFSSLLQ